MFKRLFSRRREFAQPVALPGKPLVEKLETRTLFHSPTFTYVTADNRGEVFITVESSSRLDIDETTVNKNSVQMYEAGPNGHLGDGDDVRVAASIRYRSDNGRLLVRGNIPAGNGYRVKVVGTRFKSLGGDLLDGEFNGSNVQSGNGVPGGNFEFQVKNDKSSTPLLRMYSSEGQMNLRMRGDVAPATVINFLTYANDGRYDGIFFTRNVPGFVIQGGSLQITGEGDDPSDIVETTVDAPVVNEFNISNTRGTIAMAKQGGNPNSATNQFFFNLADNSANLDNQNGGFTVFAEAYGSRELTIMDAIAAKATVDLSSQIGPFNATGVTDVPVNNAGQAQAGLNPFRDLVYFRRVALRSRVAAL